MTTVVTPTVEAGSAPPRVRLDVVDSGTPELTSVTVTRLDPDGRTVPVRTEDGNPLTLSTSGSNRVGLVYDYEAPYGLPVSYSTIEWSGVVSAPVTIDESRVWLIHPGVPEVSTPIRLRADSFADEEWSVQQGVFWPMGRSAPVVQTDGTLKAPSGSVTVRTNTLAELAQLRTLLQDASALLLNVPAHLGLGFDTSYIAVSAVHNRRFVNIGGDPRRVVEIPFQVVDRPAGGSQAQRNYVDILADYGSYGELMSAYDTYFDLLAGP